MTLRQLEYLIAVAEEASFTRAAERLYVSQPALSHQIKALEASVGGELLERQPQAVRLTPMGRAPGAPAAGCAAAPDGPPVPPPRDGGRAGGRGGPPRGAGGRRPRGRPA